MVTFHFDRTSFRREFSELFHLNNAFFVLKKLFFGIHTFSTFKESLKPAGSEIIFSLTNHHCGLAFISSLENT